MEPRLLSGVLYGTEHLAIVADDFVLHATNPSAIPPAGPRQRLVVTVHDLAFEHLPELFPRSWRLLYRIGLRAAVRRADAILTPSRNTAEDLVSRTKVRPERIHVVPLAAALGSHDADPREVRDRLKIPEPYVLFVGTLEPRKNLVSLVRAYRRAAGNGAPHTLVLAGPTGGQGWSGTGGLGFVYADHFRAQLQLERALLPGDVAPANRWLLQLGARL